MRNVTPATHSFECFPVTNYSIIWSGRRSCNHTTVCCCCSNILRGRLLPEAHVLLKPSRPPPQLRRLQPWLNFQSPQTLVSALVRKPRKIGFAVWGVWGFIFNDHLLSQQFQKSWTYVLIEFLHYVDDEFYASNIEKHYFSLVLGLNYLAPVLTSRILLFVQAHSSTPFYTLFFDLLNPHCFQNKKSETPKNERCFRKTRSSPLPGYLAKAQANVWANGESRCLSVSVSLSPSLSLSVYIYIYI